VVDESACRATEKTDSFSSVRPMPVCADGKLNSNRPQRPGGNDDHDLTRLRELDGVRKEVEQDLRSRVVALHRDNVASNR
jgi:hypothetical protein